MNFSLIFSNFKILPSSKSVISLKKVSYEKGNTEPLDLSDNEHFEIDDVDGDKDYVYENDESTSESDESSISEICEIEIRAETNNNTKCFNADLDTSTRCLNGRKSNVGVGRSLNDVIKVTIPSCF